MVVQGFVLLVNILLSCIQLLFWIYQILAEDAKSEESIDLSEKDEYHSDW